MKFYFLKGVSDSSKEESKKERRVLRFSQGFCGFFERLGFLKGVEA